MTHAPTIPRPVFPNAIVQATDRAEWRTWLQDNGEVEAEVWLVLQHARSPVTSVLHGDAIEEALCFGWIDSHARKRDAGSWTLRFTPRKPRSAWSNVNRALVERLTEEGRMTSRGFAAIARAKQTGAWSMLALAQSGVVPDDLRDQLDTDAIAAAWFDAVPRSTRRAILEWIARARRPETRQRRIARTVACAAQNTRP